MAALTYGTVGTNDTAVSLPFYDALLESIGFSKIFDHPRGGRVYGGPGGPCFAVLKPFDGETASAGNGTMFGFQFDTTDDVSAFHAKAVELGATDEGEPGPRGAGAYFAYVRDPEGNKLCGFKLG